MSSAAVHVLTTVNAPYGTNISAHQLATLIADPRSADNVVAAVFAFFSEVPVQAQKQFIADMGVDAEKACQVAGALSRLSGYVLPLAA